MVPKAWNWSSSKFIFKNVKNWRYTLQNKISSKRRAEKEVEKKKGIQMPLSRDSRKKRY
jgi:hypothetical protein